MTPQITPVFPHRRYPQAPITEALIDLRVAIPAEITIENLIRIHDEIRDAFPKSQERFIFEGQLSGGPQVGASARQTRLGYGFYSDDNRYIFQARLDGYTFSRLAPYESWEDLRDNAKRYWAVYRRYATPLYVNRIAVRYINQINLPGPRVDFDDFFLTIPKIGPTLEQELGQFLMQLQIPQPDLDALAIVTETMAPPADSQALSILSVILDIDIFVEHKTMSDVDVWNLLEALRIRKNDVFEGSITDKTRELFS